MTVSSWILACRPQTLPAAVVPVAVGTACAQHFNQGAGGFRAGPAAAALLGALLIQIGTNLANDVFDAEKGADTAERLGPTRAVQAGLLSARQVKIGIAVAFALATLCGVYLTAVAGTVVIAIGVASLASGLAYTGGPWPLGYHGLGDLFVLVFFGFVAVCGTAYVQLGAVPPLAWWTAIPVGALATAILVVNNVRDRETDIKAGKRTLAVRLGRRAAHLEYALLLLAAYTVPIAVVVLDLMPPWALLPLATAPLAWLLHRRLVTAADGPTHNKILVGTARLLVLHGMGTVLTFLLV